MSERTAGDRHTRIASHRGGADLWPENSMTAFRHTMALAVDQVEFDVHPTADGELVVHHDPTIERMTDGAGDIAKMEFATLSAATIRGTKGDRIPLLGDVVRLFRDTPIDLRLEIKASAARVRYPALEAEVAALLHREAMLARTTITAFYIDTLAAFREQAPGVALIWLVSREVFRQTGGIRPVLGIAAARGIAEIALHESDIGQPQCEAARARGIAIGAYAVNDAATIRRVAPLGLSAFTTNRPDIAIALRDTAAAPG